MSRKKMGRFIVADPDICHGKPTFNGTRIMVAQVLEQVASGDPIVTLRRGHGQRCRSIWELRCHGVRFVDAVGGDVGKDDYNNPGGRVSKNRDHSNFTRRCPRRLTMVSRRRRNSSSSPPSTGAGSSTWSPSTR